MSDPTSLEVVPYTGAGDLMWSSGGFAHAFKVAEMFAASELVPAHLRGKVADVQIAISLAHQLGENPLVVLQNIYMVSGRAGWSSQYMIARANKSGIFRGRLNWRIAGTGKDLAVTCFATYADTGDECSMTASMAMAEAEGWTKNSKYKSMPELMLRYRSAAMMIRMYAPEVMLGSTIEEIETMAELPGTVEQPAPKRKGAAGLGMTPKADVIEVQEAAPKVEPESDADEL